jgi:hypothetical protein
MTNILTRLNRKLQMQMSLQNIKRLQIQSLAQPFSTSEQTNPASRKPIGTMYPSKNAGVEPAGRLGLGVFWGACSELWQFPVFEPCSPQPPVPRQKPPGQAASRWAEGMHRKLTNDLTKEAGP